MDQCWPLTTVAAHRCAQLATEHLWDALTEADFKAASLEQHVAVEASGVEAVSAELTRRCGFVDGAGT